MKRKFKITVQWNSISWYEREVEVELTEKESDFIEDMWQAAGYWSDFTKMVKDGNQELYEKIVSAAGDYQFITYFLNRFDAFCVEEEGYEEYFEVKNTNDWDAEVFKSLSEEQQYDYVLERYNCLRDIRKEFDTEMYNMNLDGDSPLEFKPSEIKEPMVNVSVRIAPKHILELPFKYYSYDGGKMAFAIERWESNYVIEMLLRHNLKCYGEYKIVGYTKYRTKYYHYDVYHTDLPMDLFLTVAKDKVSIETLSYDDYYDFYDDEF